jgi:predicted transcriptional regulator
MNIKQLIEISDGKLITESVDLNREVKGGFAADLMSDVLASIEPNAVLITGLCNPQVVRTAVMADVAAILIVRGKVLPEPTIDLAVSENIPIITSPHGMLEVCGRLYQNNLQSLEKSVNLT